MSSVHKGNFFDVNLTWLEEFTGADTAVGERLVVIQACSGVGDDFAGFLGSIQIDHFIRHPTIGDAQVRRLDKAIFIHPRVGGEV